MPNHSMFSHFGNLEVAKIIRKHKGKVNAWKLAYADLRKLSKDPCYSEATDSDVRESVYSSLGTSEPFWL